MDYLGLIISLAVQLKRLENGAALLVTRQLGSFFSEASSLLASADKTSYTRDRVAARFLDAFESRLAGAVDRAQSQAATQALEIASYQSEQTSKAVSTAAGNVFASGVVPASRLREILANDAIEGRTAAQWWARLEYQLKTKTRQIVAESLTNGDSIEEIKQKVDALFQRATRQAEAITRTVTANLAAAAQFETAEQSPLTRFYRLHVTLDGHTSKICLAIAAQNRLYMYAPDSPRPPMHFSCRTILEPVLIGRESEQGQDAGEWLKRQSQETQIELLGKRRAEMFRAGKLSLEGLIRSDNSIATLPELRGVAASFTR